MSDDPFYVCIYLRDGKTIGHTNRQVPEFDSYEEMQAAKAITELVPDTSEFERIFEEFRQAMQSYTDMLPVVASFAPMVGVGVQQRITRKFLIEHGTQISDSDSQRVYQLPADKYHEWVSLNHQLQTSQLVGKQVPRMLLIGIVSTYEHFHSLLISEILRNKPGKYLAADRAVTLADIDRHQSISDLKQNILERDVEGIMRELCYTNIKNRGTIKSLLSDFQRLQTVE